jgi:hypothetical protein
MSVRTFDLDRHRSISQSCPLGKGNICRGATSLWKSRLTMRKKANSQSKMLHKEGRYNKDEKMKNLERMSLSSSIVYQFFQTKIPQNGLAGDYSHAQTQKVKPHFIVGLESFNGFALTPTGRDTEIPCLRNCAARGRRLRGR